MFEPIHASFHSALRAHPGPWLLCAVLVFGAGIACSGGDGGSSGDGGDQRASVEGTWTLDQDITGGDCLLRVRDALAIDQDGADLVLMFDPTGFARAALSGSTVTLDYEFEVSTETSTLEGTLTLSEDGEQLTGDVTFALTAGPSSPCTQEETWTATRTSTDLPAAAHGNFEDVWDVTITSDASCASGEGATQLTIEPAAGDSVTITGFQTAAAAVEGFVTGGFLRASWGDSAGESSRSFDAVFEYQLLGMGGNFIFGDVSHTVTASGATCSGQDGYEGQPE